MSPLTTSVEDRGRRVVPLTQVSLLRWGEAQLVGALNPGHHFMLPDTGHQLPTSLLT